MASQNVMADALLLRAMPKPSTPKGRRVRQGLRGLLEQAVVQNVESSTSQHHDSRARCPGDRHPPEKAPSVQGPMPPNPQGALRLHPSLSESKPMWMLGPPSRPNATTGMRSSLGGTTHAEAGGTTSSTIAAHHQRLRGPVSSVRQSAGPSSLLGSDNWQTSPRTQGKQTLSSGSRTIA